MGLGSQPTLPTEDERERSGPGPETVLADRYRLIRLIGTGGMGSVWEGEHTSLGTPVAVKLIKSTAASDEKTRNRFLREARAAAALRSPHVVQIFDYGVHDGTPYIAMELLSGQSLADKLRRTGGLPLAETRHLIGDLLRAVTKAHDEGVVHRDLKPDNVFIVEGAERNLAKVLDFGIAKGVQDPKLDGSTQEGTILGTPFYMSPEQLIDSTHADTRSDLWSVAVIAYECLLGHRPFTADNMASLAVALLAEVPPVPSHRGDVPPGFDAWFRRATQRDPAARFQAAREMAEELDLILAGEGGAIQASAAAAAAEPATQGRSLAPLSVGVLGIVAAVGLGYLALSSPSKPTEQAPARPAHVVVPATTPAPPSPPMAVPVLTPPPVEPTKVVADPTPAEEPTPEPKRVRKRRPPKGSKSTKAGTKYDLKELEY